jgi:hypothetical protein
MQINVNDEATVKLTDHGLEILMNYASNTAITCSMTITAVLNTMHYNPAARTITVGLWDLMQVFGSHHFMGCRPCFEGNAINISQPSDIQPLTKD